MKIYSVLLAIILPISACRESVTLQHEKDGVTPEQEQRDSESCGSVYNQNTGKNTVIGKTIQQFDGCMRRLGYKLIAPE